MLIGSKFHQFAISNRPDQKKKKKPLELLPQHTV